MHLVPYGVGTGLLLATRPCPCAKCTNQDHSTLAEPGWWCVWVRLQTLLSVKYSSLQNRLQKQLGAAVLRLC